jgi:hypothetical protein
MQTVVKFEIKDVEAALSHLGVPMRVLNEAVQTGYLSRISRTANDAPNAAGFYQWNETLRSLRDSMVSLQWQRNDDGNWPTMVHPEKKISIAVSSGNQNTGKVNGIPSTKSSKGPRTAQAVNANQQMYLGPDFEPQVSTCEVDSQNETWLLLFYTDAEELRAELSLPVKIDCEGHVNAWRERIILPTFPLDPDPLAMLAEPDFGPDIDIKIARKG